MKAFFGMFELLGQFGNKSRVNSKFIDDSEFSASFSKMLVLRTLTSPDSHDK